MVLKKNSFILKKIKLPKLVLKSPQIEAFEQAIELLFKLCIFQDDIKVVVNKHNELRRKVAKGLETRGVNGAQPKAADMYELVWDKELAASAQR